MHASPEVAQNVVNAIARHPQTVYRESYFRFHLLSDVDKDDDKFVDCAITAGADYIVTEAQPALARQGNIWQCQIFL